MKIKIYNQNGEAVKDISLSKDIFAVEVKEELIHQALVRQLANARKPVAHTLTKGEVSGGGRKPFRQKGTGNARQGSITNPHYSGGGVAFGPRNNRNFSLDMPKKQRRKAVHMALSVKAAEKKIIGLDKYEDLEMKTKNFANTISKLPVVRNVLVVTAPSETVIKRVAKNIPNVKTITVPYLNVADLQKFDVICFMENSLEYLNK